MHVVRVPGDKSISHRALILGALAEGESRLSNLLTGDDVHSSARVLRTLGCDVPQLPADGGEVRVRGVGLRGFMQPATDLDCGNSGTTVRLMLGAIAGLPLRATFFGDASLSGRPMRRVTEPLIRMGARVLAEQAGGKLPITLQGGKLVSIDHATPLASAQVKGAVLLAGLTGGVAVSVTEPHRSRDHSERMLRAQGVVIESRDDADGKHRVALRPVERLAPLELDVPGDFSAAAFFIALGLLGDSSVAIADVGVNPTRVGLLAVLERMGARIEISNERVQGGEAIADVRAVPSQLRATSVTAEEIPSLIDEVPILAMLAAGAHGVTEIRGAAELRVKESDRLAALATNLRELGVDVEELPDGLRIAGTDRPLHGSVRCFDDHRIAMAFAVLGALPGNQITLDDPGVVRISFPDFWRQLRACTEKELAS